MERDTHLAPFLAAALLAGERALCVGAAPPVLSAQTCGGDIGLLETVSADESYFHDGDFSADWMRRWLQELVSDEDDAPPVGRIAGDLAWTDRLDGPGLAQLRSYEGWLDDLAAGSANVFACFYDLRYLPATHVLDVFKTHRSVIAEGVLWDSPFYRGTTNG
jgi:hypothetical protein